VNDLKNLFLLTINTEKKSILTFVVNFKLTITTINLNNMKIFENKINNRDKGN